MDIKATKLELVKNILDTEEEAVLEQIKLIFESSGQDWWEVLSDANKKIIDEGIAQLDRGEGISHEEASNKIRQIVKRGDG